MKIPEINNTDMAKGFLAGAVLGLISGAVTAKVYARKIREDMAFQLETVENSYEAAIALRDARDAIKNVTVNIQSDASDFQEAAADAAEAIEKFAEKTPHEETLETPIDQVAPKDYIGGKTDNPYHQAVEATMAVDLSAIGTSSEDFVKGEINDFGCSYIEEDDFLDEDGRAKLKIDILLEDGEPIFISEGEQVENWEEKIGESILVDMFRLCPPGVDPILYVRNHRTDEDFEVVRVEP